MPETKGQNFQDVQESALQVTGLPVRSTNEQILSALDQDKNQPLRLHESTTPDSLLNITASKFQMFNGVEKNVTPVNNVIPNFVATTINFQTQVVTGGTVNITWPASTVGQYRLLCFTLLSSGEIDATFSDEETTIGALPNPGSLFLSGGLPIGWITLECTNVLGYFKTAGSTTNIIENKVGSDSRIFLFGSGGGGSSGAGIGEVDFLSLKLISDYNAYDDGAVSTPVDGSGGSPTVVSVSEETSNPIDTTESVLNLKVSKTAANGQGEGISVDFTTRGEIDYASPQFITVEVKSSANYEDDDFGIYIYDKDNSTLITPADPDVKASTLVSKQVFEFQTAPDADDYRLILHCKTTNANAYDLTFTVKVGPCKKIVGTPITDWESYTPSTVGLTIGNGTLQGFWRRKGDSIDIAFYFKLGSSSAVTAAVYFGLPSGLSVDSSKNTTQTTNSATELLDSNNAANRVVGIARASGSYISVIADNLTGLSATNPFNWDENDVISGMVKDVPIAGWGSNVKMADIDSNRVTALIASKAAPTLISGTLAAGDALYAFDVVKDTHGAYATGTGLYTCPYTGYYRTKYSGRVTGTGTGGYITAKLIQAGSVVKSYIESKVYEGDAQSNNNSFEVDCIFYAKKGDTISPRLESNFTAGALVSDVTANFLNIEKITGPNSILASEIVACSYSSNSGQSIGSGSYVICDFEDKEYDTHNAVTVGASWKFTAPKTGKYSFKACAMFNSTITLDAGEIIWSNIYKNGSLYMSKADHESYATLVLALSATIEADINLVKGDYIDFRIFQNSGTGAALGTSSAYNRIFIHSIQ